MLAIVWRFSSESAGSIDYSHGWLVTSVPGGGVEWHTPVLVT